jgi:phospholipid transport system substrate-binding protein
MMKARRSVILPLLVTLLLVSGVSSAAVAAGPITEIESTVKQVTKILTDPTLQGEDKRAERDTLLRSTMAPRFDFREMAKRSLGPYWNRLTTDQQNKFTRLFTGLLERAYLGRIESYHGGDFVFTRQTISGGYAEVDSKMVTKQEDDVPIDYYLLRVGNEWKIYDVMIEGISLVNNYRAQFDDVIYRYSYGELVRRMKQKLAQNSSRSDQARS